MFIKARDIPRRGESDARDLLRASREMYGLDDVGEPWNAEDDKAACHFAVARPRSESMGGRRSTGLYVVSDELVRETEAAS